MISSFPENIIDIPLLGLFYLNPAVFELIGIDNLRDGILDDGSDSDTFRSRNSLYLLQPLTLSSGFTVFS